MSVNNYCRNWLVQNEYPDVAALIDQVMSGWQEKGTKTRRDWWDVLAGRRDGKQKVIEGVKFPVLRAAQLRKGVPVTPNAICRNENEEIPLVISNGRWKK